MRKDEKEVVALAYEEGMTAPKVIAKGRGYVAQNILEQARENHIPVYKDESLATLLNKIEIGDHIPEALYDVVAQILVFVSDMDEWYGKKGEKNK